MSSGRHMMIKHELGFITFFPEKVLPTKIIAAIVHECVHELNERLQHIFEPLFITHMVR